MTISLCCLSHSPLMEYCDPPRDSRDRVENALGRARDFVRELDPELVVLFAPDHYNGFFYDMMPPYCIGGRAEAVGDFGTSSGPLSVDHGAAQRMTSDVLASGVDVALSERMIVDHGFTQPLDLLFGGVDRVPVVPVFINSVAEPLAPVRRVRELGEAVGRSLAATGKRALVIGSGGLSHDPPVPRMAEAATEQEVERLIDNRDPGPEARAAREERTIAAAKAFAAGRSSMRPLNPEWDRNFLDVLASGRLTQIDGWSNEHFAEEAGHSAHEVRTWIAAYAALSAQGAYTVRSRFYEAVEAWIAGFGVTTATAA